MKKQILTIIGLALLCNVMSAQTTETQTEVQTDIDTRDRMHFGIKAGGNYSNVYDSEGEEFDADGKLGFAGGVFISIPIGTYLGVQPELMFSQRGFKATGRVLGANYEMTRTTNYLDIPLFLSIKPAPFITLLAGPQFSYLLKQKDEFTSGDLTFNQEEEFENEDIDKNTLCVVGGVDFNFENIVVGARAGWDVKNNNGDEASTTPRYKNVWMQATIGFRF